MTVTRHPAAAYLGLVASLVAVLAARGVEGANPSHARPKTYATSVHRPAGNPVVVHHASPRPVVSDPYPVYQTPMPCGHGGGCACAANAQYYGYFPTIWRVWPNEPRPDKAFPQAIGAEPVPRPQGTLPPRLPVEEVQEPQDTLPPQEEIPPGPTAAPPPEPAEPSPSDQPPQAAPPAQEPLPAPEEAMPETPAQPTLSLPATPPAAGSTAPTLAPPVEQKDQNQPPTTLPEGDKSSSQSWRGTAQPALWRQSTSTELRFRAADGPQQASFESSGSNSEVRFLSAAEPASPPSSNGLPNLGWHNPTPSQLAPVRKAQ
jgi:hypothetical protein